MCSPPTCHKLAPYNALATQTSKGVNGPIRINFVVILPKVKIRVFANLEKKKRVTDEPMYAVQMDGHTVRPTDGWTDQRTAPHVKMRGRI